MGKCRKINSPKAQEKLIRVAKILKDQNIQFTLYIAGTGELHSELQTLIEEFQLQEQVYLLDLWKT
ncbi:MAG: glycosyltransferase [Saprospiraceae bacterium]|nr:glycosyltransferase [Saprospiraceae bacterium]